MSERTVPLEMLEGKEFEHRAELAKAQMQLVLYRQALVENGIEPPDRTGQELLAMWRDCTAVIWTASEFVGHLGSSKELLSLPWQTRS